MKKKQFTHERYQTANLIILISFTVLSVLLFWQSQAYAWETWPMYLLAIALITSWWIYIAQALPPRYCLWIYVLLSLVCCFYYGCHLGTMFDLAPMIIYLMAMLVMTAERKLITLSLVTYLLTIAYDVYSMLIRSPEIGRLTMARMIFQTGLVLLTWWLIFAMVRRYEGIFEDLEKKIDVQGATIRRMDDFLANVSHEVRTPINAVIGLTTLMIDKERDPEIKRDMRSVVEAGYRVTEQITAILDYTEIDLEKLTINNENYMISSVIHDLTSQLNINSFDNNYVLFDVDPKVPSVLVGDATKIRKIIWHLVQNGIKFSKPDTTGVVYVRIYAASRNYGVNLCIQVTDTGIGMTFAQKERVFDMLYQSDSSRSRRVGGLGLGLKITQGMVRAMDGFLTIDSEPNEGTVVSVSIPQDVSDPSPCITVENASELNLSVYLKYGQYTEPRIRMYYRRILENLTNGLGISLHGVETVGDLERLERLYHPTHLFIGGNEYKTPEEIAFMDRIATEITVIHFATESAEKDEGSDFSVLYRPVSTFGIANALNRSQETGARKQPSKKLKMVCPGVRALVVDDEPMNLIVALGILKNYEMQITTAPSGPEALKLCAAEKFDLIFMDHMMPEMDGVEAMKKIRQQAGAQGAELQFIALTANTVSSAKQLFMSEGFNGFVAKPIEIAELERVLKRLLPESSIRYDEIGENAGQQAKPAPPTPAPVVSPAPVPTEPPAPEPLPAVKEDRFAPMRALGIDPETGMHYCQDDEEFYITLLQEYGHSAAKNRQEIQKFYDNKDWKNYTIRVHALKSNSKMIGASELFELARKLEEASKNGDEATLSGEHSRMMELYATVVHAVLQVCDPAAAARQTSAQSGEDGEILEFGPDAGGDDEILEFGPDASGDSEILEFGPESGGDDEDDEIMEFLPED